jgi:signal transduction histidine kinase
VSEGGAGASGDGAAPLRVLIVDDHAAVRAALTRMVEADLGHVVVGEAGDGEAAISRAADLQPDLVLLDVRMPRCPGAEAARSIGAVAPDARIVALTAAAEPETVGEMLAAGADSYLVKSSPPAELREALARILAGEVVLAPEVLPGVVADLAGRLRAEQERIDGLLVLERAKREFVSLVSDRLVTPLTTISGASKTLWTGWHLIDDEARAGLFESIDRQCERLAERVAQILAVTRLQGDIAKDPVPFQLDGLVKEVVGNFDIDHPHRTLRVEAEPVEVNADRTAVWGVVHALLDNALVHTTGDVVLRTRRRGEIGAVEVIDEGPGIEPAQLRRHLGEPFTTGDATDGSRYEGMGLSLYTASRVVDLCKGELRFDTGTDRGTTAVVELAVAAAGWAGRRGASSRGAGSA